MFASVQGVRAPMFRSILVTAAVCSLLTLGACGGGGSDAPGALPSSNGSADVYVGTWMSDCNPNGPTASYRDRAVFTKSSSSVIRSTDSTRNYTTSNTCSGAYTESSDGYEDLTIVGTKTVDGKTVDTINGVDNTGFTAKLIAYVSGNDLFVGFAGTLDSEGYPTQLGATAALRRQ